jgi:hypothetical protein
MAGYGTCRLQLRFAQGELEALREGSGRQEMDILFWDYDNRFSN